MDEVKSLENRIMLRLLAQALFGAPKTELPAELDLAQLYRRCKMQSVTALVFDVLPSSAAELHPDVFALWRERSFDIVRRGMKYQHLDCELHRILTEGDIPHCTLKGSAAAMYYPNAGLRQMGDIDFIVPPSAFDRAHAYLIERGFAEEGKHSHRHQFHTGLTKNGMVYEMHFSVSKMPKGKESVLRLTDELIPTGRLYKTAGGELLVPDAFHHGMVLLLHMQRHLSNNSGLGLRHLCDWLVFVDHFSDEEFRRLFEEKLRGVGLWHFARVMALTGCRYLGLPHKSWMGESDSKTEAALINEMLDSGTFGGNDAQRAQEDMFLRREGESRSAVGTFFAACRRKVCIWKPFYETHRLLLPIGFTAYCFRILWLLLCGKMSLQLRTAYRKGSNRTDTLESLRLFHTDTE